MSESQNFPKPMSVKLGPDQWAELFENINLAEEMIPGKEKREYERLDYAAQVTLYAEFDDDDEATGWQRYLVCTRNVSASGLGFIHHAEVVVGSRVLFTAFDAQGRACSLAGVSARADLIEQKVWDIGIKFNELIDPAKLLDADGQPLAKAG